MFTQARDILRQSLEDKRRKRGSTSRLWASQLDGIDEGIFAVPRCEYIVYLQQHEHKSVSMTAGETGKHWTHDLIELVEDELRVPMGAPVPPAPRLRMSMTAFSPDCGFVIESKGPPNFASAKGGHFQGPKMEVYTRSTRYIALSFAAVVAFQIVLLIRQQKDASTPSMRSRISFYSIAMLAFGDGFTFFALIYASLLDESTFYTILGAAIFAFVSISFFGMRFLLDIWTVQATERSRQQRQTATSTSSTRNAPNVNSEAGSRPILPVHADIQPIPVIIPSDQDIAAEEQSVAANTAATTNDTGELSPVQHFRLLWGRFSIITFCLLILCMYAETWPGTLRALFVDALAFIYLSFWWPQIYRNVMRNCRRALRWDFVLGQSILRLLPAIYIYAVEDNILFARTDVRTLLVLLSWVWIQILVLLSQELLGARFLVPDGWAPPAYDYHPVIREDEEDATLPTGYNEDPAETMPPATPSKPGESKVKGKRTYDCTICGNDVEVVVIPIGGSKEGMAGNILGRRGYMVTPCRHVFHTPCLEGWMRYRLQCPNCRETLPPL
jgi:transmembrane E3 ubiquitin-protein ligase